MCFYNCLLCFYNCPICITVVCVHCACAGASDQGLKRDAGRGGGGGGATHAATQTPAHCKATAVAQLTFTCIVQVLATEAAKEAQGGAAATKESSPKTGSLIIICLLLLQCLSAGARHRGCRRRRRARLPPFTHDSPHTGSITLAAKAAFGCLKITAAALFLDSTVVCDASTIYLTHLSEPTQQPPGFEFETSESISR